MEADSDSPFGLLRLWAFIVGLSVLGLAIDSRDLMIGMAIGASALAFSAGAKWRRLVRAGVRATPQRRWLRVRPREADGRSPRMWAYHFVVLAWGTTFYIVCGLIGDELLPVAFLSLAASMANGFIAGYLFFDGSAEKQAARH